MIYLDKCDNKVVVASSVSNKKNSDVTKCGGIWRATCFHCNPIHDEEVQVGQVRVCLHNLYQLVAIHLKYVLLILL